MNHDVSISDLGFVACILEKAVKSGRRTFLIHTMVTAFISTMIDFPSDGVKMQP